MAQDDIAPSVPLSATEPRIKGPDAGFVIGLWRVLNFRFAA